jgi:dsRNA-specific ribonuclease
MAAQQSEISISGPEGASSKPKESFLLVREKFSDSQDIDYDGLEDHIHYKFSNRELLRDALYPLVPKRLNAAKLKFEHLEFVGDSVLGLIIRERLVTLFPREERGILAELYSLLTKNQTLADVYFRNMELERYIPFPEKVSCKICNLVESLIGAIYLDDPNGPINAKMFVMQILNDHVLAEKVREVSLAKNIGLGLPVFPELNETIQIVCTPERLGSESPKTLLNEVLLRLWTDRPTYEVCVKVNADRVPSFSAIVSGAQIGRVLQGEGNTSQEAEEEAARNALNFLAKRELLQKKNQEIVLKTFRTRLKEYLDILNYNWEFENVTPQSLFRVQIKFKGETASISQEDGLQGAKSYRILLKEFFELSAHSNYKIGETILSQGAYNCQIEVEGIVVTGAGPSKVDAREDAAKKAFLFLRQENATKFSPLLQLFLKLEGLDRCEFNNITSCQPFLYRVIEGDKVICEGTGPSKIEAKENAAREAYSLLIQLETEKTDYREKLKLGVRPKPPASRVPAPIKQSLLDSSSSVTTASPNPSASAAISSGEAPILSPTSTSSSSSSSSSSPSKQGQEGSTRKKIIRKRRGKATQSQERPKLDERAKPSASKLPSPKASAGGKPPSFSAPNLSQIPAPKDGSAKQIPKSSSAKK